MGVGLTSQYLEQAGRKLFGGLLGKVGGGLLGGLGKQAVSSGMSFASTYALGHVAKRYYAGGRTLSTQMLKDAFSNVVKEGQGLQTQYRGDPGTCAHAGHEPGAVAGEERLSLAAQAQT